jgi:hypothetical protein
MGSLVHAMAAVGRVAETVAAQVGSAVGFFPERVAIGRKVAAAVVGTAMAVVPMAQSPHPGHQPPPAVAPIPSAPVIPEPAATLPDAPAAPAPDAPAGPVLPDAVLPELPGLAGVIGGASLPKGTQPATGGPTERRPSTGDVIEAIQRVLGTLPQLPLPPEAQQPTTPTTTPPAAPA